MKVYFGAAERPNALHTLIKAGGSRIMLSYAEPPSETCWQIIKKHGLEVLLDSGAFSTWKRGIHLCLSQYMAYIGGYDLKHYFNLDVVGNPETTAKNQAEMEAAGLSPIPVFHCGEPWKLLDILVSRYTLIGLGGTVGKPYRVKERWFQQVFTRHPFHWFHGLGLANDRLIRQFPFHSADSVWWVYKFRDRQKRFAPEKDRKAEQAARVRYLLDLEKEAGQGYQQVFGF